MRRATLAFRDDKPAVVELAAGAVVVSLRSDKILLLHHTKEDRWCLPKGHVDPGETVREAARREIREEAGVVELTLGDRIATETYDFFDPGRDVSVVKVSLYFRGTTPSEAVELEDTFDRYQWVSGEEGQRLVSYDSDRRVIAAAIRAR